MSERSTQEPRGVVASLEAAAKYLRERFGHTNIVADDCERAVRAIRAMGAENASLHENVAALLSRIAELEKDRERLDVLSKTAPDRETFKALLRALTDDWAPQPKQPICSKCGGTDIYTRWRKKGQRLSDIWWHDENREYAADECLFRVCRTCEYRWTDKIWAEEGEQ